MRTFVQKNLLNILCVSGIVIFISFFIYSNRADYFTSYDIFYWKDRFEHSQWVLPMSRRIIGDDALFSHLGYRMVLGDDPTKINAETLPVGKYLIGLSIFYLGNPAYYALSLGIFTLIAFFGFSKKVLQSHASALFLTTLLLLEPLFFTQLKNAWIDILQLFLLLSHWFLLLSINKKSRFENYVFSLTCGMSLGLFTETKLPVLLPIVMLVDTFIMWKQKINGKYIALLLFGFLVAVFASYIRFFMLGKSLNEFITVQKYIVSFYLSSQLTVHLTAVWKTLLTGVRTSINGTGHESIREWTILWPILTVNLVVSFYFMLKKQIVSLIGVIFFSIVSLVIFSFIPFYPRYLTLVIPFLYILLGFTLSKISSKKISIILIALLVFAALNTTKFFYPTSEIVTNQFFYNMSHQFFQDIYVENLSKDSRILPQYRFSYIVANAYKNAGIETMDFTVLKTEKVSSDKEKVTINTEYKTRALGSFFEQKEIILLREHNKWKVVWDWDFVVDDYQPTFSFSTSIIPGKRGAILDTENTILAKDTQGYLIQFDSSKADWTRENEMLKDISHFTSQIPVRLQNTYLENPISKRKVDIATTFIPLSPEDITSLQSYPGLTLIPYPVREYYGGGTKNIRNTFFEECCSRIYTSHNYEGISGVEKEFNEVLKGSDGGSIRLLNNKGEVVRMIHNKEAITGDNVIVSNTH